MSLIDKQYVFDYPLNVNEVFNRIMSVANNIPGMKFKGNPNPLTILLKTGVSLSSWGEKVTITCQYLDPMHTRVAILSKPVVGTTLVDWGKGGRNIKKVIAALEKVLPPV